MNRARATARCTVALLLEVDPIALVRGPGSTLTQYVNDRPHVAGSLPAVALGSVFRTVVNGHSKSHAVVARTAPTTPARARRAEGVTGRAAP
ncbi:hypothetical protein [Saccharothrix sp. 6-C]|uniref:hypothetical protein n=1 Tax=Saccharothrix sp. 6-C TaxID=2781735 RepID=UPI003FA72B6D